MIVLSLSETREFPRATISNNMPTHCRLRAVLVVYCVLLVKSWDPIITSLWRVGKPSKPISVRPTLDGTRTQPNNTFLSLFAFAPSSYLLRLTVVSIFEPVFRSCGVASSTLEFTFVRNPNISFISSSPSTRTDALHSSSSIRNARKSAARF